MGKVKRKRFKCIQWLDFGIYPGTVMFVHDMSYAEVVSELNGLGADLWSLGLRGDVDLVDSGSWLALRRDLSHPDFGDKVLYYLFVKGSFDFSDYDYCRLAHEVLHIVQFHLPGILDRDREIESEAYLHTYLMGQCLRAIRGEKL